MFRHRLDFKLIELVKKKVADGMSYSQVGESLGISKGSVAGIMHRYRDTNMIDLSNVPREEWGEAIKQTVNKLSGKDDERSSKKTIH